jgi:hypothetical protein
VHIDQGDRDLPATKRRGKGEADHAGTDYSNITMQ